MVKKGVNVMLRHLLRHCGHICNVSVIFMLLFVSLYAVTAFCSYECLKGFHIEQAQFFDLVDIV